MSNIVYYRWGKLNPHTPRPPQCGVCCSVHENINNDLPLDTERDAQLAWALSGVTIVNDALKTLWPMLWKMFQCPPPNDNECKKKVSCGAKPTYIEAGVHDVDVLDNTSLRGKKRVWELYVTIQRDIKCEKGDPKDEKDDPVPSYDELPEEPKDKKEPGQPEKPKDPGGSKDPEGPK